MNEYVNTDKIIKYMKDKNLTETEFCKRCKISVSTLEKIFNSNESDIMTLYKIAQGMKVDLCFMYRENDKPYSLFIY